MLPQEIVRKKRLGEALSVDEITAFIGGITDGSVSDAQIGAWAMAVCLQGMNGDETIALTQAMRDSGDRLDWSNLPGPVVDKHSTGGIGDKVSLILAPLLAACGCSVPMLSGRGLGHTGGTLDKLESIEGYTVDIDEDRLRRVIDEVGCAIVGASAALAPADKRLYGIRDVTATVESLPLITASILSKKLAAGVPNLVMDVKFGSGAFCTELAEARELAQSLVDVANGAGCHCSALLTDMNQCLGANAGNALEVREAIAMLRNEEVEARLFEVTMALASNLLLSANVCPDHDSALRLLESNLSSGEAAERFNRMVYELGGPSSVVDHWVMPKAPCALPVPADRDGFVQTIDGRQLGLAIVELGGGRRAPEDAIDPRVGLAAVRSRGSRICSGEPLAMVHARNSDDAKRAINKLTCAFAIGVDPVEVAAPIHETIGAPS